MKIIIKEEGFITVPKIIILGIVNMFLCFCSDSDRPKHYHAYLSHLTYNLFSIFRLYEI